MARTLPMLDGIRVASPCPESWAAMKGDDRVRHCDRCSLNVYNLSGMTRDEAESLITERQGSRLCVRYYQRADGTILTRNCPVGLARVRWAVTKTMAAIAAAFTFLFSGSWLLGNEPGWSLRGRLWNLDPYSQVVGSLAPQPGGRVLPGTVILPPKNTTAEKYLRLLRARIPEIQVNDPSPAQPPASQD